MGKNTPMISNLHWLVLYWWPASNYWCHDPDVLYFRLVVSYSLQDWRLPVSYSWQELSNWWLILVPIGGLSRDKRYEKSSRLCETLCHQKSTTTVELPENVVSLNRLLNFSVTNLSGILTDFNALTSQSNSECIHLAHARLLETFFA